jgi:hypothetical protein
MTKLASLRQLIWVGNLLHVFVGLHETLAV